MAAWTRQVASTDGEKVNRAKVPGKQPKDLWLGRGSGGGGVSEMTPASWPAQEDDFDFAVGGGERRGMCIQSWTWGDTPGDEG